MRPCMRAVVLGRQDHTHTTVGRLGNGGGTTDVLSMLSSSLAVSPVINQFVVRGPARHVSGTQHNDPSADWPGLGTPTLNAERARKRENGATLLAIMISSLHAFAGRQRRQAPKTALRSPRASPVAARRSLTQADHIGYKSSEAMGSTRSISAATAARRLSAPVRVPGTISCSARSLILSAASSSSPSSGGFLSAIKAKVAEKQQADPNFLFKLVVEVRTA